MKINEYTFQYAKAADARDVGQTTYTTGKPCPNGHNGPRWTSTLTCVECSRTKRKAWRQGVRAKILQKFDNKCGKCGYDADSRALQIDHVNGGGSKQRRSTSKDKILRQALEDTSGLFQLLCAI
jgi:hypothetical protein